MNENQTIENAAGRAAAVLFDHEKLDVYHLELKFIAWVTPLLEDVSKNAAGKTCEVRDQLDRASLSLLLNTAEGNGKRRRQIRAKFFDDARGSGTECAACLDALVAKGATTRERVLEGKNMLLRVVSMLCGLIDRFDSSIALHDEPDQINMERPEIVNNVSYHSKNSRTRTRTSTRRI
jgi:four helix bundle protein